MSLRSVLIRSFAPLWLASCTPAAVPPPPTSHAHAGAEVEHSDSALAQALGAELATRCPQAAPNDADARRRCADALTPLGALEGYLPAFVLWGAQSKPGDYDLSSTPTTRFDPLVLRRLYLSTFMFGSDARLERDAQRTVLHVPVHFRYALDPGEYPYPFWHSEKKWQSYQRTEELLFVFEASRLVAVLRSAAQDASRVTAAHACQDCLEWKTDDTGHAHVALYRFMFSAGNPHVAAVDDAYRAFEKTQRSAQCMSCHNPSNPSKMNPLELFSYPNQALGERHTIVRVLEHNHMPPAAADHPAGIADEHYRHELIARARAFAAAGDRAVEYERGATTSQRSYRP